MPEVWGGPFLDAATVAALVLLGVYVAKVVVFGSLAIVHERWIDVVPTPVLSHKPLVSIIVPCFNEDAVIESCVRSLLTTFYPKLEIFIVDDGSTDGTERIGERLAATDSRVNFLRQRNSGKAAALNHGLECARGEIVVTIDADSAFRPNTLPYLVAPFADGRVGAVGGNVKVANRRRLFGRQQGLEYAMGVNLQRRAFAALGCMQVISGAVGAFRRIALDEVGGFPDDTVVEDMDVTIAIAAAGYRVQFAGWAVATTEAPRSLGDWMRQRYRWTYGGFQVVKKYRHMLFSRRHGSMGLVGLPFFFAFPWIDVLVSGLLLLAFARVVSGSGLSALIQIFLVLACVHVSLALLALWLDGDESLWLAVLAAFDSLWYTPLLSAVTVWAGITFLFGRAPHRTKASRNGDDHPFVEPSFVIDLTDTEADRDAVSVRVA